MKKKRKPLTFLEKLRKIKNAGIQNLRPMTSAIGQMEDIDSISERIKRILDLYQQTDKKPGTMIFFIMYDIENDKIRTQVAKYLLRKGCLRVQKSIFIAQKEREVFNELYQTIKEIQEVYDNNDSVFFVPVSVDALRSMKIVGQSIDFDLVMDNRTTLFF